jgi:hypothetical protein
MAQIANTYDTYSTRGIREELSDVIYRISPEETPLISNIGRGETVGQPYYEWQNDALAAAGANDQIEGDDYTSFPAVTPTTRLANYVQISTKQVIVSGSNEKAVAAGRKSELAYQLALRSAELKRDMEFIASQNQAARAGSNAQSRRTAGIESFLRTNTNRGTGGAPAGANPTLSGTTQGFPNAAPVDNSTTRAFTETILRSVMQSCFTSGGKPSMLLVGPAQKQVVSTFAGIAQQRRDTGDSAAVIIGAADVYLSDFGKLNVVPSRFSRNRTALFLQPEYAGLVTFRPFQQIELAKTGDAEKRLLLVEWGTKVMHEAAHGVAADLA